MATPGSRRWLLAPVIAVGLLLPRPAGAAAPAVPLEIVWRAPEECPNREAALAQLRALLVHRPAMEQGAEARVEIVRGREGRFVVAMQTRLGTLVNQRRFDGATCEDVVRATTLIIAMALDPVGVAAAKTEGAAAPQPAPVREPLAPAPPPRVPGASLALAVGARASGDAGSLPLPTLGAGIAFDATYARWFWELSGTLWMSRRASRGPMLGAGADISLKTAAARVCWSPAPAGAGFYACLGSEVGITMGRGVGIRHPRESRDTWVAASAGIALRRRLWRGVHVWTNVDAGVPVRIPSYFIEGYGEVSRPWPVIARGTLGADISFL